MGQRKRVSWISNAAESMSQKMRKGHYRFPIDVDFQARPSRCRPHRRIRNNAVLVSPPFGSADLFLPENRFPSFFLFFILHFVSLLFFALPLPPPSPVCFIRRHTWAYTYVESRGIDWKIRVHDARTLREENRHVAAWISFNRYPRQCCNGLEAVTRQRVRNIKNNVTILHPWEFLNAAIKSEKPPRSLFLPSVVFFVQSCTSSSFFFFFFLCVDRFLIYRLTRDWTLCCSINKKEEKRRKALLSREKSRERISTGGIGVQVVILLLCLGKLLNY